MPSGQTFESQSEDAAFAFLHYPRLMSSDNGGASLPRMGTSIFLDVHKLKWGADDRGLVDKRLAGGLDFGASVRIGNMRAAPSEQVFDTVHRRRGHVIGIGFRFLQKPMAVGSPGCCWTRIKGTASAVLPLPGVLSRETQGGREGPDHFAAFLCACAQAPWPRSAEPSDHLPVVSSHLCNDKPFPERLGGSRGADVEGRQIERAQAVAPDSGSPDKSEPGRKRGADRGFQW